MLNYIYRKTIKYKNKLQNTHWNINQSFTNITYSICLYMIITCSWNKRLYNILFYSAFLYKFHRLMKILKYTEPIQHLIMQIRSFEYNTWRNAIHYFLQFLKIMHGSSFKWFVINHSAYQPSRLYHYAF